jgi:hypothetical protein
MPVDLPLAARGIELTFRDPRAEEQPEIEFILLGLVLDIEPVRSACALNRCPILIDTHRNALARAVVGLRVVGLHEPRDHGPDLILAGPVREMGGREPDHEDRDERERPTLGALRRLLGWVWGAVRGRHSMNLR